MLLLFVNSVTAFTSVQRTSSFSRFKTCANKIILLSQNKQLTDLGFSNIISSEDGTIIIVEYYGDSSNGTFSSGRVAFYSIDENLEELTYGMEYPMAFVNPIHEYDEEDIQKFAKYYHLENF